MAPGDPDFVDQALAFVPVALTLYCSLPFIHNHLEDLSAASKALLMTLPLSAPPSLSSRVRALLDFHSPLSISVTWNLNTELKLLS